MKQFNLNFTKLIDKIRTQFGDDKIFLTICPFDHNDKPLPPSTFASDNIEHLENFVLIMKTQMFSGTINQVSVIARKFTEYQVQMEDDDGKKTPIPIKEIYHFLVLNSCVIGYSRAETEGAQYTDAETREQLSQRDDLICMSSEEFLAT